MMTESSQIQTLLPGKLLIDHSEISLEKQIGSGSFGMFRVLSNSVDWKKELKIDLVTKNKIKF